MKQTLIIMMGSICLSVNGQQSLNSVGGNVQGSDGSVSFSIGQIATSFTENGFKMNEGVQQPYEFFTVLSIENDAALDLFTVSPNPTSGIINLTTSSASDATVELIDEAGRLIWTQSHQNILSTSIDLTDYSRGTYLIRVVSKASSQIIKIIKN